MRQAVRLSRSRLSAAQASSYLIISSTLHSGSQLSFQSAFHLSITLLVRYHHPLYLCAIIIINHLNSPLYILITHKIVYNIAFTR